MQCNGGKYDGVSIPARKHAITIVGCDLQRKIIFYFNVTYFEQAREAFQRFSEKIENPNLIKIWKILPYGGVFSGSSKLIKAGLVDIFPKANVERLRLEKDHCFLIERHGSGTSKYKPETSFKKTARGLEKLNLYVIRI
ncbi:MAG: hypothetical protein C5B45_00420 [Chlamydiae bacterium]|nr:MAG: hypothetical protein C5B45_00420 [Chlamydiota bacterium]